jgi:hypothetical protein
MKTTLIIVLLALAWVSCTEEVIVEKEKIVTVTDTVTETIILMDTLVDRQYTIDTAIFFQSGSVYSVPADLKEIVTGFYIECRERGLQPAGGLLYLNITVMDAIVQAESYVVYQQVFLNVNGNQTKDEMMIPIYRELARQTLGKEYSADPTSLMYPFYPSNRVRWSNRSEYKDQLDTLFK